MLSDDELGFVLHYRLRKETSGVVPVNPRGGVNY